MSDKKKLLNNNNIKPTVKESYYTNGMFAGYKPNENPCPKLPKRFIIAQNWMTLKRSFAILKPPSGLTIKTYKNVNDTNFSNETNKNNQNHVRNLHGNSFNHGNKENLIGHYYTKMLSLRGMFGFPRVRLWEKPRTSKGKIVGEVKSIGSWSFGKMTDYRFVFECGNDIYFISERKSGFFGNIFKSGGGFEEATMTMEIYKFKKEEVHKFNNFNEAFQKENQVANVKISRKAKNLRNGSTTIVTTIKFFDTKGKIMSGTSIKRITNVYRDWKSGLRSKFLVENASSMPGFLIGFFAYIYAWKEFHDGKAYKTISRGLGVASFTANALSNF